MYHLHSFNRNRSMGSEQNHWMGLGYYQLRLVGWNRARRNTDFCRATPLPPKMENGRKPICGSHDHFCGSSSGTFPNYSHGASMACLLGTTHSKPIRILMGKL